MGFDKEGSPMKNFVDAEIIKQGLSFLMKVKTWSEKNCQIKPISTDIVLNQEQRREREKILGKEFLDPLLAVDDSDILLCEDAILRKYAEQEEFSVSGMRLFNLIEYLVSNIGFQRGLFFLSPVSRLPGVINIIANFLIELCQKPSLLPYNKQIITKELLDKSSFGRDESPKDIAYQVIQLVQVGTKFLPICVIFDKWKKKVSVGD